jgi:cell shape-determining protein MreD
MIYIFLILTFLTVSVSAVTTIPFSVGLLVATTVIFKQSWVFFLAFGLGLFLDLIMVRVLGYSSLMFTIFALILFLYERKFETRNAIFVFIASFLGSLVYLRVFNYQQIFLQSLINSLFAIIFFKLLWLKSDPHSETT